MNFKAIETHYKGYRFRSRLEARWAIFFDTLSIPWEYESEGYEINGVRYLPDFWLPDQGVFVEVKGQILPSEQEFQKCCDLSIAKRPVYILAGQIPSLVEGETLTSAAHEKLEFEYNGYHFLNGVLHINYIWTRCRVCKKIGMSPHPDHFSMTDFERLYCTCYQRHLDDPLFDTMGGMEAYIKFDLCGIAKPIVAAYTAARSARFEFGEKGR